MNEQETRRKPGRPPLEDKEPKREVHLYIPESLARKVDLRRNHVAMSAYILQLIEDDIESVPNNRP